MITKWFRNLRLRSKIILLVAVLVIFTGIIGVQSVINLKLVADNIKILGDNALPKTELIGKFRGELGDLRLAVTRHMLASTEAEFKEHEASFNLAKQKGSESLEALGLLLVTGSGRELYDSLIGQYQGQFMSIMNNLITLSRTGASPEILEAYRRQGSDAGDKLVETLDELIAEIEAHTHEVVSRSMEAAAIGRIAAIAVLVVLSLVGLGIGFRIANDISKPVRELVRIMNKTASGDLTEEVVVTSSDEIGNLMKAFGDMTRNLRNVIAEAVLSAHTVAGTSQELAASAEQSSIAVCEISSVIGQMSAGIEEQTASTSETAISVHQLNEAIAQVAKGAESQVQSVHRASSVLDNMKRFIDEAIEALRKVNSASRRSAESARRGGESIENIIIGMVHIREAADTVAATVDELNKHSEDICGILEVIDDIADQTNLLALNAAIEAARAGEHGRGFAVVADEVRKLAERSSTETKAITNLVTRVRQASDKAVKAINIASEQVEAGGALTVEAKSVLEEIVQNASHIETLISNLMQLGQDLAEAGNNAAKSMEEIVSISEENTASAEEMAASSEEVGQAIDNITSVSEEAAASVEEIVTSAEQVNVSINQIAALAGELANMAAKLQEAVSVFKIS